MAQVDITVNNQNFLIACEDGQEDRLMDLSKIVDDKVGELAAQVGQVGQVRKGCWMDSSSIGNGRFRISLRTHW